MKVSQIVSAAAIGAAALGVVGTTAASAAPASNHTAQHCSASGYQAGCSVNSSYVMTNPRGVWVTVRANPRQKVETTGWYLTCFTIYTVWTTHTRPQDRRAPFTVHLRMPPGSHKSCFVVGGVNLNLQPEGRTGRVSATVRYSK